MDKEKHAWFNIHNEMHMKIKSWKNFSAPRMLMIIIHIIKIILDVKMEKAQKLVTGIEGFDSTKLRHTETNEKNPLPDKDGKRWNFNFW